MAYKDEMVTTGNRLFRWRSYVPLLFLLPVLLATRHFSYFGDSHSLDYAWEALCLSVSFLGVAVRCLVVGYAPARTSGRNTSSQIADTLNSTGLYSLVRHPLYVGNLLMWLGVALFLHDWRIVLLTLTTYWLYYERIVLAEEAFLREQFGAAYEEWAARVPAFIPRRLTWEQPPLPFSFRNCLRREYAGTFAVVAIMFILETLGDRVIHGSWSLDPYWAWFTAGAAASYLTLRTLKRHTTVLVVPGR